MASKTRDLLASIYYVP